MPGTEVSNWPVSAGMELKISGVIHDNPARFTVNLGKSTDDIAIHFDLRFNHLGCIRTIVMNSKKEKWSNELRSQCFTFDEGKKFQMTIHFNFDVFDIYLPTGAKVHFPNRHGELKYDYIFFNGDGTVKQISVKPSKRWNKRYIETKS